MTWNNLDLFSALTKSWFFLKSDLIFFLFFCVCITVPIKLKFGTHISYRFYQPNFVEFIMFKVGHSSSKIVGSICVDGRLLEMVEMLFISF